MTDAPWIYVVAGPNGAGKSTLARMLLPDLAVVNPDDIARALSQRPRSEPPLLPDGRR